MLVRARGAVYRVYRCVAEPPPVRILAKHLQAPIANLNCVMPC